MALKPCHLLLSTILAVGPGLAAAQTSRTIEIDGDDPAYQFNAGFNYQVVDLTITNAAEFTFDATELIRLDTDMPLTLNVLGYLFRAGEVLPVNPANQLEHQTAANLVAHLTDGNPNGEAPVGTIDGAAEPLAEGQYQLILAPYDLFGYQGDHRLSFSVTGGVLILLPTTDQELAQLVYSNALGSRAAATGAVGSVGRQGRVSLASRNAMQGFRRAAVSGALTVTPSSQGAMDGAPGLVGNTYTWVEVTGFQLETEITGQEINGRGLQIGADWGVGEDWVVGVSFGIDDIASSGAGFSQQGVLRTIQPYVAYDRGHFHLEASVLHGWGDFTQTSIGGKGHGESELRAASFEMGYDFAGWNESTITPTISILAGSEEIVGISGTLAGAGRSTVDFTEVSLGATVSRGFGNGLTGTLACSAIGQICRVTACWCMSCSLPKAGAYV